MLSSLIEGYLWIAVFTFFSILYEWRFTGTESDYALLREKLTQLAESSTGWFIFGYLFVLLCGSLLWWYTYYCRICDVWRRLK